MPDATLTNVGMNTFDHLANSYGIALGLSLFMCMVIFGLYLYERKKRSNAQEDIIEIYKENQAVVLGVVDKYYNAMLGTTAVLEVMKNELHK